MDINNTNEELYEEYKKGNRKVELIFLDKHIRYITKFIKRYIPRIERDDAFQLAKIGMIRCLKTWDSSKGGFLTWSSFFMKDELHKFLYGDSLLIKVPLNMISEITTKVISGKQTTDKEKNIYNMTRVSSLNYPSGEDSELELIDLITSNDNVEASFLYDEIKSMISNKLKILKDREQLIIKHYYGLDDLEEKNFEELSEKLDISRQRVFQIHNKAIEKLKRVIRKEFV